MDKNKKRGVCKLQLNSISSIDEDPTLMRCTFSIIDFNVSGNNQIIPRDLAIEASPTLKLKPLLCQYSKSTNDEDNPNDHFGGHGEEVTVNRHGEEVITTNSIAVGTSTEKGGYIGNIKDENGQDKEVLLCDFVLWRSRFSDICELIEEMWSTGLPLYSSCEYWYSNYEVENGVSTIKSPLLFDGHCILQSNENDTGRVLPAYDSSKMISLNERFNKAVAQAINQNNKNGESIKSQNQVEKTTDIEIKLNNKIEPIIKEENKNMTEKMFKKVCELSYGDTVSKIYTELSKLITGEEYNNCWISDYNVFDTYFIYESYTEADGWSYYKVNYTKDNEANTVVIDIASKSKVEISRVWTSTETVDEMQSSLNTANATITTLNTKVSELEQSVNSLVAEKETLTTSLNEKEELIKTTNSSLESITKEKDTLSTQFNDATIKLTSLNELVNKLVPVKEAYEKEQFEKALNEKTTYYAEKFEAVKAKEKFESQEIQSLIKLSINSSDEGKNAILQLNSILVDMVKIDNKTKEEKQPIIKEMSSKQENLIPTRTSFEEKYGL